MIIKTPQTELFHSYCRTKYRTFMGERSSKDVDAVNGYITSPHQNNLEKSRFETEFKKSV